jgi:type IV secretory pathway VirJ component
MFQCGAREGDVAPERFTHAPFDTVRVYRPHGEARHLAVLISGDGGWGAGIGSIAQDLAAQDTIVAGIDGAEFLRSLARSTGGCASPGEELAQLSQYLTRRYRLPPGALPILIGHSAGASLAYVALAQAPPGTFAGLLTLSFCTELDLTRPLCPAAALRGSPIASGIALQPGGALPAPWVAVHGTDDRVCAAATGAAFAAGVPGTRFAAVDGVDHDYRDRNLWWPAFIAAYRQLADGSAGGAAPP